ncbi:MAG TPA: ATP-binding protein, partial [Polyangiaceae bacterium]|nr:ATP-binding protein [Polyangiaceae bacterium]
MTSRMPAPSEADADEPPRSAAELLRSNDALRREAARLRRAYAGIAQELRAALVGSEAERESRRAALNLMEDAIAARRAEQVQNDERRRVEDELREANRHKDELLTTLRESKKALEEGAARQAFLLVLTDRLRSIAEPMEIMKAATELYSRHLGIGIVQYTLMDARGEYGELAAIYANGRTSILLPSERLCPGDPPGWTASLREGRELFFPDDRGPKELGGNETNGANIPARSAVPVLSEGRTVAVLAAVDEAARSWPETDRQLHREVAERTWAAVERARTETALRESNAQREHLLAAARAAQAEAEEANRAKDEFLATLSHELRTPLAAILLWSGAIKSGAIQPSELGRAVEAIVQSAKSQSRLIEDLLDLSRLTSRRLLLAVQNTSIEQLLRAAVEVVRPGAEAKNIGLELDLPGELGVAVLDPTRIQQVLWNLLSNGIKFTPPRGRVTLRARKKDRQLEIEVADTGEGIPLNFVPHLFQRFRQADMRETRKYAGLGIGLALSRYIVELHNGTIEAHSDGPGTGACFSVHIPWLEVDPTKTRTDGGAAPPQSLSSLHDVRVLLVEDDESTRDAMRWT